MIKSPCVKKCKIAQVEGVDTCIGCLRTLEQIKKWSVYTDRERDEIIDDIKPHANNSSIHTFNNMHLRKVIYTLTLNNMTVDVSVSYAEEGSSVEKTNIDRGFSRMQNWSKVFTELKYL